MAILSFNYGPSSVKYQLYDSGNKAFLASSAIEKVSLARSVTTHKVPGRRDYVVEHDCPNHEVYALPWDWCEKQAVRRYGFHGAFFLYTAKRAAVLLGIVVDPVKNKLSTTRNAETEITGAGAKIRVFVIPTDEELVMTEDAFALMAGTYDVHTNYRYSFQDPAYVNKARAAALSHELIAKPALGEIVARAP